MRREKELEILVYGTELICASCVNAPSSKETASWLQSLLERKYNGNISVRYIDFQNPSNDKENQFARKVLLEDLWYPVVVIEDEIITEGNPNIGKIYAKLDSIGLKPLNS